MAEPKAASKEPTAKELTAAEAAKRVKRTVVETTVDKDNNQVVKTKRVDVSADEVFAFRDHGTHVVVVTTDGQKLSSVDA